MSDLIEREDAIKAVEECLKLLARPRYTVKTAIEAIPSVDIPHSDDWEKYSDKLWKNAYERGKEEEHRWWSEHCAKCTDADRPQEWIPCSERLPKIGQKVLASTKKTVFTQVFKRYYSNPKRWAWENNRVKEIEAWQPLPKPWEGADDEM